MNRVTIILVVACALISTPALAQLNYTSSPSLAIPDNTPAGVTDTIIASDSGTITDINIQLTATHTWVGDLIFSVQHGATTVIIVDRPGVPTSTFGCSGNDINAWLDDEAVGGAVETQCAAAVPTIAGTFTPNNPLSAFDGADINGSWVLTASDNGGGDTGTLLSWTVQEPALPVELMHFSIG